MERIKGTSLGIVLSLGGVVLWVIFAFIGFIAGIAGALMGIAFVFGYRKMNPDDESKYPVIVACVLIIVEIVIAELLTILIIVNGLEDVSFAEALAMPDVYVWVIVDIVVGLLLSYLVFGGYLYTLKRKNQMGDKRKNKF